LGFWGYCLAAAISLQITIVCVTVYLHRDAAHRSVDLHPALRYFARFWIWFTAAMLTREWVAVHRKHHAKCETVDDPHSPVVYGLKKILLEGAELYQVQARNPETLEKYGRGCPDDWFERNIYTRHRNLGIVLLIVLDLVLFGVPGIIIVAAQMLAMPLLAAGVINGLGHHTGYRNFECPDAATNIVPWGLLLGGEELHNNHHAYPTSAKFSIRWYEFDLGWMYIKIMEFLGLATVRKTAPKVKLDPSKFEVDAATLQAVIAHRYDVLANYAKTMKSACATEIAALGAKGHDSAALTTLRKWLHSDARDLPAQHREKLDVVLASSPVLKTTAAMRQELARLWERSTLNTEQLVSQLKDWCERAEKSDLPQLADFSRRLRSYA
jgi:stearoyl-CoA desaturase (delta-9 desaturase)